MTTATASADHDDDYSWLGGSKVVKVRGVVTDGEQAVRDGVDHVRNGVDDMGDALRTNDEPGPGKDDSDADGSDADGSDDADEQPGSSGWSSAHQAESLRVNEQAYASPDGIASLLDGLFTIDYPQPGRGDVDLDGALDDTGHLDGLRDKLRNWLNPADGTLPGLPGGITDGAAPMPMPAPSVPAGVGGSVADNSAIADSIVERSDLILSAAGGSSDRGADVAASSDLTDSPSDGSPLRLPAGAPAAPSAPVSGGATGGHADGSPFAVTYGSGLALTASSAAKAISGAAVAPIEPGRQPGVTPD